MESQYRAIEKQLKYRKEDICLLKEISVLTRFKNPNKENTKSMGNILHSVPSLPTTPLLSHIKSYIKYIKEEFRKIEYLKKTKNSFMDMFEKETNQLEQQWKGLEEER